MSTTPFLDSRGSLNLRTEVIVWTAAVVPWGEKTKEPSDVLVMK